LTPSGGNSLKANPARENTKMKSPMRSFLLTYPKKKEDNKKNPTRLRGKREERMNHLRNNSEM